VAGWFLLEIEGFLDERVTDIEFQYKGVRKRETVSFKEQYVLGWLIDVEVLFSNKTEVL
jgi:hypothetical protein